jgi:hypothetical protein
MSKYRILSEDYACPDQDTGSVVWLEYAEIQR